MKDPIMIEICDNLGEKHQCRLIEKFNNQNGGMLYVFRNERTNHDFSIRRSGNDWGHMQGELPKPGCLGELADQINNLNI